MHGEIVPLDQEAVASRLIGGPVGNVALGELSHRTAGCADQVMVMAATAEPVDDLAARPGDRIDGAALHQERHRALGRPLAQTWSPASTALQEHRERQAVAGIAEGLEDRLALWRSAQAVGPQTMPDGLGCRNSHGLG